MNQDNERGTDISGPHLGVRVGPGPLVIMALFSILLSKRVRPYTFAVLGSLGLMALLQYGYESIKVAKETHDMLTPYEVRGTFPVSPEGVSEGLGRFAGASAEMRAIAAQEFDKLNHAKPGSMYIAFRIEDKSPNSKTPVVMAGLFAPHTSSIAERMICYQDRAGIARVYREDGRGTFTPWMHYSPVESKLGCERTLNIQNVVSRRDLN